MKILIKKNLAVFAFALMAILFAQPGSNKAVEAEGPNSIDGQTINVTKNFSLGRISQKHELSFTAPLSLNANGFGLVVYGKNLDDAELGDDHSDTVSVAYLDGSSWVDVPHDEFSGSNESGTEFREITPRKSITLKVVLKPTKDAEITSVALGVVDTTKNAPIKTSSSLGTQAVTNGGPTVVSRSGWGADESLMTWDPEYAAPIKKIVFHHTAGALGGSDPASVIRGIYYYHSVTRGWGDIGYNYLIDEHGKIYEGRYGGQRVVGAHAKSYNSGSIGISTLGNYETITPSSQAVSSAETMAAFLSARNGISPKKSSFFVDKTTPNIGGHRDFGQTSCPGDNYYSKLPEIRGVAAANLKSFRTNRIEGSKMDRFDTAIGISQDRYPRADEANFVVLVNGYEYSDSIIAAPLAASKKAPLLLTDGTTLTPKTLVEIQRVLRNSGTVYLVGDEAVLSAGIETALTNVGLSVIRVAGENIYATDAAAAALLPSATSAFLVTANNFPDGITASAPAALNQFPILFSDVTALPTEIHDYLATTPTIQNIYIVGGTTVITDDVVTELEGLGKTIVRYGGLDRYDASKNVADAFFGTAVQAGLVTGNNYPDAIVAGPYAGWLNMPLLLTDSASLSSATYSYVRNHVSTLVSGRVFGGTTVVPPSVAISFDNAFPSSY
jgi:putative cell wall-binding protein